MNNTNVSGSLDLEQDVPLDVNSPRSPESIIIPPDAYENRANEGFSDTENNTVDETENAGQLHFLEGRIASEEASNPEVDMQSTYDVEDEIKEIDEILLSELDTVGDFSVKEYDSGFDTFEKHVTSGIESSSVPRMTNPIGNDATDDNSNGLDEIEPLMYLESSLSQAIDFETQAEEVISVSGAHSPETASGLDTDMSTGELVQREIQRSDDPQPTKMVTLANENEVDCENSRTRQESNPEISPVMPAIEARSIEDIESMFRKVKLSVVRKDTEQDGPEIHTEDQINEATSSGMPVPEAQSPDDVASASKQMNEHETENPNINAPLQAHGFTEEQNQNSSLPKPKMGLPIVEAELKPDEDDDDFDLNEPYEEGHMSEMPGSFPESLQEVAPALSDLPVTESRPSGDATLSSESHLENVLESNTSNRSREVDANEEGTSSKGKLGANELPARDVIHSDADQEAEIETREVQLQTKESQQISSRLENLESEVGKANLDLTAKGLQDEVEKPETSSVAKVKGKKSHKSSSSSSSSSDSSSSDSDKE